MWGALAAEEDMVMGGSGKAPVLEDTANQA